MGSGVGAQDPGQLCCWEALAELHREKAGSRDHQEWPTGHSLWDPRGRGLQLHRERPGEQECMRDRRLLCPSLAEHSFL